jgi:hypothetical protein
LFRAKIPCHFRKKRIKNMGGLKRVTDRYISDKKSALISTQFQLDFVRANMKWLALKDKKGKWKLFIESLPLKVESISVKQRTKIEDAYELTMKGYNLPSINKHIDRKRKGLRF